MKIFAQLSKVVLSILGLKEVPKNAEGKFALSDEQKAQLTGVVGSVFVEKFEAAMNSENGEDHSTALVDALVASAAKPDPQIAILQGQLATERKAKETLQSTILTLSAADEPEPAANPVGKSVIPSKQGVAPVMKINLASPNYRQVAEFFQTGRMASEGKIVIEDLMAEFGTYLSQGMNNFGMVDTIFNGFTSASLFTEEVAVTEFRSVMAFITSVSQQFVNKWTPSGEAKFDPLKIPNRRHKINMPITPSSVMTSYMFKLYRENLSPEQQPIFLYIWQKLILPQLLQDIELRMIWKGRFEELNPSGVTEGQPGQAPEKSMDGIETQVADNFVAGNAKAFNYFDGGDFDWFDTSTTDEEVLEFADEFVSWMSPVFQGMEFPILCSREVWRRYRKAYKNKWGEKSGTENTNFGSDQVDYSTKYFRPVDGMYGSPQLIATPPINLIKLRHINDVPNVINDIQKQDYMAKIFGEYWLGAGFNVGPATFVYHKPGYDPYAKVAGVYGVHTDFQQLKGTNPDKSVQFGSGAGSAGGGV